MKGFSITRGSNIFSIRSDIFWLKDFVNTNVKVVLKDNYNSRACKANPLLRNFGFNNNSTQHCVKRVQILNCFWSVFSFIWTEYGYLLSKSPYSVRI